MIVSELSREAWNGVKDTLFPKGTEKVSADKVKEVLGENSNLDGVTGEGIKKTTTELSKKAAANQAKEAAFQSKLTAAQTGSFFGQVKYYMFHTKGASTMGTGAKIVGSFAAAALAAAVIWGAFKIAGAGKRNMHDVTQAATAAVAVAGTIGAISSVGGPITMAITAVVMGIWIAATYQDYSQEIFTYQAQSWQPLSGGEDCEKCNEFRYGCSEYQCHSLGKSCEIVNKGTIYELCDWVNEDDMLPPELTVLESALLSGDYIYMNSDATLPEERGAKVIYNPSSDGCLPPFTPISFGVESDKPAECKIDGLRKNNLSQMSSYMLEGNSAVYNHTVYLPASGMPSREGLEAIGAVSPGEEYTLFIRCESNNGIITTANFLMEFCIDDGPDKQAPIIKSTNYLQESYVTFNQSQVPLEVYTNEPADCRWDFQDLDYDVMNNEMWDCSQTINQYLSPLTFTYGCRADLTGIKDGENNEYYIRCKDKPWLAGVNNATGSRIANKDSYVLNLKGTYPLQIDEITINGEENGTTIIDSTNTVQVTLNVKTSAGANEGKAKCQYGIAGNFYDFFNNGNFDFLYENVQDVFLSQGNYEYDIKCRDEAGNSIQDTINFEVDIDKEAPMVVRMYSEEGNLKLITNEEATCVYATDSTTECNYAYEDGIEMTSVGETTHYVDWNTETNLYIKCKDVFGNLPILQDDCSIIARAFE